MNKMSIPAAIRDMLSECSLVLKINSSFSALTATSQEYAPSSLPCSKGWKVTWEIYKDELLGIASNILLLAELVSMIPFFLHSVVTVT